MARKRNNNCSGKQNNVRTNNGKSKPQTEVKKPGDITGNSKLDSAEPSAGKEETETGGHNDPNWYSRFPELLLGASNVPFSDVFGSPIDIVANSLGIGLKKSKSCNNSQIGICSVNIKPSFGAAANFNDPLNTAAHMLYTHVRYVNSGRKNYDQADLMLYVGAVSDLYSFIYWMKRGYKSAFVVSQRNGYINENMLNAIGIDSSITTELAQFRAYINMFIAKVSTLVVPAEIEMFKRRAFMYSEIYTENDQQNIKDQLYCFRPEGFYVFDLDDKGKGMLRFRTLPSVNGMTLSQIMAFGNEMLSKILGDEDFGIMSGDIMKAFQNALVGLTPQEELPTFELIYDPYVLLQIKNAYVCEYPAANGAWINPFFTRDSDGNPTSSLVDVPKFTIPLTDSTNQEVDYGNLYQDGFGNLQCRELLGLRTTLDGAEEKKIVKEDHTVVSFYMNQIISINNFPATPEAVVEATRLKVTRKATTTAGKVWYGEIDCMSELVTSVNLYYNTYNAAGTWYREMLRIVQNVFVSGVDTLPMTLLAGIAQCRYLPLVQTANLQKNARNDTEIASIMTLNDLLNYTVQDIAVIDRLNAIAKLSLLAVPGVSTVLS